MSDQYLNQVNPDNILNVIRDMQIKLQQLDQREVAFNRLDEVTNDLGDQLAGRFLALASGSEPTDPDANGAFMSALGEMFGDILIKVGIVKNGELQFGFGPEAGVFSGGKGIINSLGILMDGLNFLLRQTATNEGISRIGKLSMLLPDGEKTPAYALEYSTPAGTELLTNGGAETGDFTGWTDFAHVNGIWQVIGSGVYEGSYCFAFVPTGSNSNGWLISEPSTVTELKNYLMSGRCAMKGIGAPTRSVIVEWLNSGGTILRTDQLVPEEYIGIGWVYFEKVFTAPAGAANARVTFKAACANPSDTSICFDSFSISEAGVSTRLWLSNRGAHVGNDVIPVVNNRIPVPPYYFDMTAVNSATNGVVDAGLHEYVVTYVDSFGETTPFGGKTITATGGKQVNLGVIPIGPSTVIARKIYRSKAGTNTPRYLVGIIGNNTATTFADNVSDANLGAEPPAVNTTGSWPTLPKRASWFFDEATHALNITLALSASQMYGMTWQTAPADANDGDTFTFSGYLAAGTYILSVLGNTYSTRGMLDWYIDETRVTAYQDWYSAAAVYNVIKTASITVPTSGYHVLRGKVNSKNAASTDYVISLTKVWLKMAAD